MVRKVVTPARISVRTLVPRALRSKRRSSRPLSSASVTWPPFVTRRIARGRGEGRGGIGGWGLGIGGWVVAALLLLMVRGKRPNRLDAEPGALRAPTPHPTATRRQSRQVSVSLSHKGRGFFSCLVNVDTA